MEYVRICDAYGAGYFYIPGTETCLSISGWVRYQIDTVNRNARVRINVTDSAGDPVGDPFPLTLRERLTLDLVSLEITERDKGWSKTSAAQVNFDARSETEYGTLRGWIQLEGERSDVVDTSDIPIYINHAVIQLGGLWMGYTDSLFTSSSEVGGSDLGNYGGFTNADTFNYHYEQRQQIGYQFNGGNGFWGGIALEHDGKENYTPDVVGKVAFSQGWGGVWLAAAYDESADGVGVRGGVQGNFGALTARFDAYYQSNVAVSYGRNAKWALQGTAIYQINPQFAVAGGLEYRKDLALAQTIYLPNSSAWAAQIGINWEPVQNFVIGADVTHNREKASTSFALGDNTVHISARQDWTALRLRFQRNF